jgi:hypothetical protein
MHPQFWSVVVSRLSFVVVVGNDFGPLTSQASVKEVTPSNTLLLASGIVDELVEGTLQAVHFV